MEMNRKDFLKTVALAGFATTFSALEPIAVLAQQAEQKDGKAVDMVALLGGEPAEGIRYRYLTQGVAMLGQSLVIKHKKTFYYLHYYTRDALAAENQAGLEQILNSARWR